MVSSAFCSPHHTRTTTTTEQMGGNYSNQLPKIEGSNQLHLKRV